MALTLDTSELRLACLHLLEEVERRFGTEVNFSSTRWPMDEYWSVPLDDAYSLVTKPEVDQADLGEDVDGLREMLKRREEGVSLWHELDHLAGVLRAIAFLDLPHRR